MVGVVAHQRGQVESNRKPPASMLKQILVALISFLWRGKAGELAHGEKLAAVSGGMNPTGKGRLSGITEILVIIPVLGQIRSGVKAADGNIRNRGEAGVPVLVEVRARGRTDRPLRSLLQSRRQRLFRPLLLCHGRMAPLEPISDWILCDLRLGRFLVSHEHPAYLDDRACSGARQGGRRSELRLYRRCQSVETLLATSGLILFPRQLPRFGIFPRHVYRVIQVQQQTLAS